MTKKQIKRAENLIVFTRQVNRAIPRNGSRAMDNRAFELLVDRLLTENEKALERLAKK